MPYDFHSYIADTMLAAQEARNADQHGSADMLDADLNFAVKDAARAGVIKNPDQFRQTVAQRVLQRGGSRLHDILVPPKAG